MKYYNKLLCAGGLLLCLGACSGSGLNGTLKPSMFEDTTLSQRPITIEQTRFVERQPVNMVDYAYLSSVSHEYTRHGASPIYAVLAYDPDVKNGKLTAFNKSNVIKGQLAKLGVRNAVVQILPVPGVEKQVVIGYDYLTAQGPENCGHMPGYNTDSGAQGNYGLGCTLKDMTARQVAYVADLAGQSEMSSFEAGRVAAPVNRDTRSGEISEFVPNYILSEIGE